MKEISGDLAKMLRKACSNAYKPKITCVQDDESQATGFETRNSIHQASQGGNKRGANRSKSRSKKPPASQDKRVERTAKALGIEINNTLDRISELDAQNELLMLENQKLKDEILDMQQKHKE